MADIAVGVVAGIVGGIVVSVVAGEDEDREWRSQ